MTRFYFAALAAIMLTGFGGIPARAADTDSSANQQVAGRWQNEDATFEIYAENGKLNGKIVALRDPLTPDGKTKTDIHNPDATKRDRPIIGLIFMTGFTPTGPNKWENGTIYDPKSGNSYSCSMELQAPDKLRLRGYVLVSLIGRTQVWTRVSGTR